MASLKIQIDEKLAKRFREVAMKMFGYSKGSISKAAEASIRNWIDAIEEILQHDVENPVDAIDGLLKDIKVDSVTLQHKLKDFWLEEVD
ncbi:MAG: hypothetical protein J7L07_02350 [Candidatus Odinarchaeota archaeon]|nr:hypothetical protein [Candidatus Odinarchaeota archaeon]